MWVLTGDKIETAINIGFSCELLDKEMELFIISENNTNEIYKQIKQFNEESIEIGVSRNKALVVGGD